MTERKHVLVADWASGDFTSEQARMQPHGISIAGSGIVRTDSFEEKHAKLKRAIEAAERIDALMFCIAPIDAEIISMLPDDCKLLQRNGTGLDNVDLEKAAELVTEAGGSIVNVDATLIAEAPKILPHVPAMKAAVARALSIRPDRVGIKATTNELLGFLGRGEGMAAMAVAGVNLRD